MKEFLYSFAYDKEFTKHQLDIPDDLKFTYLDISGNSDSPGIHPCITVYKNDSYIDSELKKLHGTRLSKIDEFTYAFIWRCKPPENQLISADNFNTINSNIHENVYINFYKKDVLYKIGKIIGINLNEFIIVEIDLNSNEINTTRIGISKITTFSFGHSYLISYNIVTDYMSRFYFEEKIKNIIEKWKI